VGTVASHAPIVTGDVFLGEECVDWEYLDGG
jgi:hypothetical protein